MRNWQIWTIILLGFAGMFLQANELTQTILATDNNAIAMYEQAIKEISRRSEMEMRRQQAWIDFYKNQQRQLQRQLEAIVDDWDIRINALQKVAAYVQKTTGQPDERINTPLGFYSQNSLRQKIRQHHQDLADLKSKINAGTAEVQLAGLGFFSRKKLQEQITSCQRDYNSLKETIRQGEYQIYYFGINWITYKQAVAKIAEHRRNIRAIRDQIKSGDYRVHIPGFGWATRKDLETRIHTAKQEIAKIERNFQEKNFSIHRKWLGWARGRALDANIFSLQREVAKAQREFKQGQWRTHFAPHGWITGVDLRMTITDIDRKIKAIETAVSRGEYKAYTGKNGWLTEKQARKQIKALKRMNHESARKSLEEIKQALPQIGKIAELEISCLQMRRKRYERAAQLLELLLAPQIAKTTLDISQRQISSEEFKHDSDLRIRQLRQEIQFLQQLIAQYIPR